MNAHTARPAQAEGERIASALTRARATVFPLPLVIAGPTAVVRCGDPLR